ncbi:MADS-box transcription factor PHERES 2 [Cajanus cajan]|uniref:Agamous-like MADS-box protein AGL80 n=1 Tax=Cajanus cajan TaxID=3821 RepID=A0A151RPN5_CAJCA|nr:MADS-box transcription factor PHERES 2 [Cajanus cajan]KYP44517.1 Agamous-like MADS-box protein AGL80 [Cajanus cajan]
MARKKVKLAFIANDSERKISYRKRKKSVLKKTEEISTICGVEACAIVYNSSYDPEPQVWPSESGVQQVLRKFRSLPEWEQMRNMVQQENFIRQSIHKQREKVKKLAKDNKQKEMTMLMYQCLDAGRVELNNNVNVADLKDLSSVIEQKLQSITTKLEMLNVNEITSYQPQMQEPAHQHQMQMQTPVPYQPQIGTPAYQQQIQMQIPQNQQQIQMQIPQNHQQIQMQIPAYQPQPQMQIQTQAYQSQIETPTYQQQMQMLQTPAYQPEVQRQTTTYVPQNEGPSNQPQMQTRALAVEPEEMTLLNMNTNPMQSQWFMDTFLIGNGDETMFPPFGDDLPF